MVGQRIVDLFAHPGGGASGPMARILNFFNGPANRRVADVLGLRPGQRVLEVGFGGGAAIASTAERLGPTGLMYALDLSHDMAAHASRAFSELVAAHRVAFACSDVTALPLKSFAVDHAYAVHSHLYWPDPLAGIKELGRVLRPGGRLLLAMDTGIGLALIRVFGRAYDPVEPPALVELLRAAGFEEVTARKFSNNVVGVIGTVR